MSTVGLDMTLFINQLCSDIARERERAERAVSAWGVMTDEVAKERDHAEALEAERALQARDAREWYECMVAADERADALEAQNAALRPFLRHGPECRWERMNLEYSKGRASAPSDSADECDCGLRAALSLTAGSDPTTKSVVPSGRLVDADRDARKRREVLEEVAKAAEAEGARLLAIENTYFERGATPPRATPAEKCWDIASMARALADAPKSEPPPECGTCGRRARGVHVRAAASRRPAAEGRGVMHPGRPTDDEVDAWHDHHDAPAPIPYEVAAKLAEALGDLREAVGQIVLRFDNGDVFASDHITEALAAFEPYRVK